jgi:hypothetical protein
MRILGKKRIARQRKRLRTLIRAHGAFVLHGNPPRADASSARAKVKCAQGHERTHMTTSTSMRRAHASYPFQLRDPVSGRFVRARFIAQLKDIAGCCAAWEILAPARPEAKRQ